MLWKDHKDGFKSDGAEHRGKQDRLVITIPGADLQCRHRRLEVLTGRVIDILNIVSHPEEDRLSHLIAIRITHPLDIKRLIINILHHFVCRLPYNRFS
ncbi:hypothetical protein M1N88_02230 [Dehalococcoidia bacterium]|nr:hypothetical protein [Dehalococcoidia bacterium]